MRPPKSIRESQADPDRRRRHIRPSGAGRARVAGSGLIADAAGSTTTWPAPNNLDVVVNPDPHIDILLCEVDGKAARRAFSCRSARCGAPDRHRGSSRVRDRKTPWRGQPDAERGHARVLVHMPAA
jgi:hypothetical protein